MRAVFVNQFHLSLWVVSYDCLYDYIIHVSQSESTDCFSFQIASFPGSSTTLHFRTLWSWIAGEKPTQEWGYTSNHFCHFINWQSLLWVCVEGEYCVAFFVGFLLWVEMFMKSWKRLPELNFVVKFCDVIDCRWCNVNFELGTCEANFCFDEKDGTLQCQLLREKLVSQARPNQPQCRLLTKDYPRLGWLGRACETSYVRAYHAYKSFLHFSVHFHSWDSLRKGILWI